MNNVPTEGVSPAVPPPVPLDGVIRGSIDIRDPNGLPMTYAITQSPTLGDVGLFGDGSWIYEPTQAARLSAALAAPGTETRDTFSWQASDADGPAGFGGEIVTVAPATLALTHQIAVPATVEVFGAALSFDGKRIFIGDFASDDVVIVHTDDDSTQTVPLTTAGTVEFVALAPLDPTLYITQAGPPHVIALDTSALTVQTPLTVSQGPLSRMAVDGKSVYVGDMYGAKIVVINTDDNSTHTIPLPAISANQPNDMAVGPDHTLWVACISPTADAVAVMVIDTATDAVTPINLESFPDGSTVTIAASPDGSRMYVCQYDDGISTGTGHVTVIDTATHATHTLSLPGSPSSAAVTGLGSVLCVITSPINHSGNGNLVLVDTTTEQVITTLTTTGYGPRTPLMSPDGVTIYVPQGDGPKVEVYTLAGTGKWSA
jgi:hypothetical protein